MLFLDVEIEEGREPVDATLSLFFFHTCESILYLRTIYLHYLNLQSTVDPRRIVSSIAADTNTFPLVNIEVT